MHVKWFDHNDIFPLISQKCPWKQCRQTENGRKIHDSRALVRNWALRWNQDIFGHGISMSQLYIKQHTVVCLMWIGIGVKYVNVQIDTNRAFPPGTIQAENGEMKGEEFHKRFLGSNGPFNISHLIEGN